jgi:hypothetical protein
MDMLAGDRTHNDMLMLGPLIEDRPKASFFVIDGMLTGKAGLNIDPEKSAFQDTDSAAGHYL